MQIRVRRVSWYQDRSPLRWIRRQVFIEEQGVPVGLEWDGLDGAAIHLLAQDLDGRPIGTTRVLSTAQIARMAVLPRWRCRGVGSSLLTQALQLIRIEGLPEAWLHAQLNAIPFYLRHHFVVDGPVFHEAGIAHRRMRHRAGREAAGRWLPP